jgi:hypothetical protein
MNTIGQGIVIDSDLAGQLHHSLLSAIFVAIPAALVGTFTLKDGVGATLLTKTPGQSGAFSVGPAHGLNYTLTSATDLGNIAVAFRTR